MVRILFVVSLCDIRFLHLYIHQGPHNPPPPPPTHTHTHTHSDDEEIHHIDIQRDGQGFGFSIRGGAEYNAPLCVLRIAEGGAAERDNRLKVHVGTRESHCDNEVMKSNRQMFSYE